MFSVFATLLQELDQRYNALLQMYGEKVEQAQELQLDLQDVKEMYKSQVLQQRLLDYGGLVVPVLGHTSS